MSETIIHSVKTTGRTRTDESGKNWVEAVGDDGTTFWAMLPDTQPAPKIAFHKLKLADEVVSRVLANFEPESEPRWLVMRTEPFDVTE